VNFRRPPPRFQDETPVAWHPSAPHYALLAVLGGYLLFVLCGAFTYAPWIGWGRLGGAVSTFGDLSGARYSFGFFAPDIPNPVVAVVTYRTSEGEAWEEVFGAGTRELDHRLTTMMTFFTVVDTDNLHATALAAYALGHHPEADQIDVSLKCHRLPSMEEFRNGIRPSDDEYYWARFGRRAALDNAIIE